MLKPEKWQATFDNEGKIMDFKKVLKLIILGGVDPSIRPEVWEFLLGCYALGSTAEYRRQLRTARRERYMDLIKQCQSMHSSVGTGSLAYVVGSKVMDMRMSSKDDGIRENEDQSGHIPEANANNVVNNNCVLDDNCIEKSHICRRQSSGDSDDFASIRESKEGAYDYSGLEPSSGSHNCTSPIELEADGSQYVTESYLDSPTLPFTNLFEKSDKNQKEPRFCDDTHLTQRKLKFGDEHMHSFQIDSNADLVVESNGTPFNDDSPPPNSESEMIHPDVHESLSPSNNLGFESEMFNRLRISDAPEISANNAITSRGGAAKGDRVSEWLWTLHQIVVDVVRTDNHLEFYEDKKNLARMSDILAVYAWVDPATGYCQGMSDLLSPFVVLFEDNADAFWCFEMLLRRMMEGPTGVMKQLQTLWHILELTDREMFSHLSQIGAESLHFAFRMLLVLFRRELSFSDALRMWEMIWAADFDESLACDLDEICPELLLILLPKETEAESGEESLDNNSGCPSKHKSAERSISDNSGIASASARPFCGLTKNFWSRNDRLQIRTVISSRNGDDELPVFCVAAILIMNRQKITKETRSIDDLIKIFNDNLLKIRVKSCVRSAIKLRKKYIYKMIKSRTPAQNGN
ncbi:small G protein signaling modulator 1-like isoform X2 [Olea europaea var. sylvestris]|uniref:small G protein signaling modulator 1-like isoform X2 n=1 Tax=Olea europaea var. sylvestris TaxID=158386 RepID=UPI000C1D87F8|nr:small G protein signaling modulator 1-like isoform X2 [Olea europaea var. sylvestris]